jgi:hypothetical protein
MTKKYWCLECGKKTDQEAVVHNTHYFLVCKLCGRNRFIPIEMVEFQNEGGKNAVVPYNRKGNV